MEALMQRTPLLVTRILDYAAKVHGEQEIISRTVEGPTVTTTYAQLHERARLCALALRRLGVRPGDRVATLAWNTFRHVEAWYGTMGLGAICHTLNPRLFDKDLEFIANHAGDTVLMADACFADLVARLLPRLRSVRTVIFLTEDKHMPKAAGEVGVLGALCYEDLLEAETASLAGFRWEVVPEDTACGLCYTSGTTGNPKGVLYSHRSNFLHAISICLPDALDMRAASTMLAVVPMFHASCWGITFAAPMTGARLVLPGPYLDGPSIYALLDTYQVTHTGGVPTVWLGLMEHMQRAGLRLGHLKLMVVGGAVCPRRIIDFYQKEHGVEVRQQWGMTETSPNGTMGALKGATRGMDYEGAVALKLKQGWPHVFCDMRIVDASGGELPHDGVAFGNLQVRGPFVLERYYNSDAPGADADGWFDTGDVATIDSLGHMQITDRSKDVIKSGGEWISSIEIENVAVSHPKVLEAAVIAIRHEKWNERPLLVVVPREGESPTREELLAFLEGKIARWWIPDDVVFVEDIPHTATGKISKLELRRRMAEAYPSKL